MRNLFFVVMAVSALLVVCRDGSAADVAGSSVGGIGVQIANINDEFFVVRILPGTPAERAGISAMDVIVAIDSEQMGGQEPSYFISRMQGQIGTPVVVLMRHPDGTYQSLALQRASLTAEMPPAETVARKGAYTPASPPQAPVETAEQSLAPKELAHFTKTMTSGKPAQLYALAITMEQRSRQDLASKLYAALIDRYPDSPYTEKAINKMEGGSSAPPQRAAAIPPQMQPQVPTQMLEQQQAAANCNASCSAQYAACQEQASNDNEEELVGGITGAMMGGGGGGMLGSIISGQASSRATAGYLMNKAMAGDQCEGSLRVCGAGCGG